MLKTFESEGVFFEDIFIDKSFPEDNSETKPKKKRGRKPRHLSQGQPTVNIVREKKKRGRKPKEKYNFNTEPLDISDQINENENIIVKLPIKTSDLNNLQ